MTRKYKILLKSPTTHLRGEDRAGGLHGARRDQNWRRSEERTGTDSSDDIVVVQIFEGTGGLSRTQPSVSPETSSRCHWSPGIVGAFYRIRKARDGGPESVPEVLRVYRAERPSSRFREKRALSSRPAFPPSMAPTHWCAAEAANCPSGDSTLLSISMNRGPADYTQRCS